MEIEGKFWFQNYNSFQEITAIHKFNIKGNIVF
jgi:hypothetical protein